MKNKIIMLPLILISFAVFACNKKTSTPVPPVPEVTIDWAKAADSAQSAMVREFWNTDQHYFNQNNNGHTGFNYWWNAHVVDVLIDKYNRDKSSETITFLDQLLAGIKAKNGGTLKNNFYDDMEWLAISLLRTYEATGNTKYKDDAVYLWDLIKGGWTDVCGGGIMWEKNAPNSKNACSNGPAIIIAARLYQLDKKQEDLDWAKKIYDWERASLVDPSTGAVWDGMSFKDGAISVNKDWKFTYNMGTFLGGALELYNITKDKAYLDQARKTATYTISSTSLSPAGILDEGGTGDGGLFKGIFIRYFTQLAECNDLENNTKNIYRSFVKDNATSLWKKGTLKPQVVFDPHWRNIPAYKPNDCSVQLSGVMLLEAAAELKRKGFL